CQHYNDLVSF
nr:immunoglobulin light chain junction region [Macaca mulatta]MOV74970.1 immunoglobulin light chain junction region [Macaca mulatta]MOV76775.1 immunoglobulin light chain junction region [Macaca mulatta]